MSKKVLPLRGLIYGKYESEAELAKLLGWPRQRLNKITCGAKTPDIAEIDTLAKALDTPIGEMARFFLPQ